MLETTPGLPRAVICDIDGTLVTKERPQLTEQQIYWLRHAKENGALIMAATGRIRLLVPQPLLELADYCVCGNGGIVYDHSGEVLCETPFQPELVDELVQFCDEVGGGLSFSFASGYGAYRDYQKMRSMYLEVTGMDGNITDEQNARTRHLTELPFSAFLIANESEVYRFLRHEPRIQAARQHRDHFDVYPVATTKAAGISQVLQRHHIDWKDVVAFGDSPNDLEMLAAAGRGYAMGNASPEAKTLTRLMAPTVWEDGVAQILKGIYSPAGV